MYLRLVTVNVQPDKLEDVREMVNGEVNSILKAQKGFRLHYLLESDENPGEIISATGWESKEVAESYEQSGTYEQLKEKFQQWFTSTPELKTYEVHSYIES